MEQKIDERMLTNLLNAVFLLDQYDLLGRIHLDSAESMVLEIIRIYRSGIKKQSP